VTVETYSFSCEFIELNRSFSVVGIVTDWLPC